MNGSNYIKYKTLYIINCGPPHKSTTVLDGKKMQHIWAFLTVLYTKLIWKSTKYTKTEFN